MKKKLLVFGCSYADKSYVEITTKNEKLKEHMYDNEGNLTEHFDFCNAPNIKTIADARVVTKMPKSDIVNFSILYYYYIFY